MFMKYGSFVKALSVALNPEGGKRKLSHKQLIVSNAAYGIYAHEVAKRQQITSEEITNLKLEVERGNTALAQEKTRTVTAMLFNRESLHRFGRFWIEPISDWGTPEQLIGSPGDNYPEQLGTDDSQTSSGTSLPTSSQPDTVATATPDASPSRPRGC